MMQAVMLAAGLGTRLRPVTATRSKAMVPVLGRPLVERAMTAFVANGVSDFVVVIAPDDAEIRPHFATNPIPGITVRCVVQEQRLGMADALRLAVPFVEGRFFVSACDSLVDQQHVRDLADAASGADAVLSLLDVDPASVSRSAAVSLNGDVVTRIVEKPAPGREPSLTASIPHYVFSQRVVDLLPRVEASVRGEYEIQDAIQALIDGGGRVVGVPASERLQVSTPWDLLALTRGLMTGGTEPDVVKPARIGLGTQLIQPLRIEEGVVIGDECEVGPEVFLESGSSIGHRAVVRRSIVLREGRVGDGESVEDRVVT